VFAGKPIIGIVGGIGSGKSLVAKIFGQLGCLVIDSDAQVTDAYRDPNVLTQLRQWWGDEVFLPDGSVNRKAIGRIVFTDSSQRQNLESLIHPMVSMARNRLMHESANNPQVLAYVWDTPLLVETGLDSECDTIVYVEASHSMRLARVAKTRGWHQAELDRRENLQFPLDKKKKISDYVIDNTADADNVRGQVSRLLPLITATRSEEV
jgi:dephospho-CoA kinase